MARARRCCSGCAWCAPTPLRRRGDAAAPVNVRLRRARQPAPAPVDRARVHRGDAARARTRRPGDAVLLSGAAVPARAASAPRSAACACACCCRARSTTGSPRWPRRCCTTSCAATACASSSTRRPSCTPRWRWSIDEWATVGSSNIDPLSLLLNLEANVIVRDEAFANELSQRFDLAVAASREVTDATRGVGWRPVVLRGFVAWCANWLLRMAGISSTGRRCDERRISFACRSPRTWSPKLPAGHRPLEMSGQSTAAAGGCPETCHGCRGTLRGSTVRHWCEP